MTSICEKNSFRITEIHCFTIYDPPTYQVRVYEQSKDQIVNVVKFI